MHAQLEVLPSPGGIGYQPQLLNVPEDSMMLLKSMESPGLILNK